MIRQVIIEPEALCTLQTSQYGNNIQGLLLGKWTACGYLSYDMSIARMVPAANVDDFSLLINEYMNQKEGTTIIGWALIVDRPIADRMELGGAYHRSLATALKQFFETNVKDQEGLAEEILAFCSMMVGVIVERIWEEERGKVSCNFYAYHCKDNSPELDSCPVVFSPPSEETYDVFDLAYSEQCAEYESLLLLYRALAQPDEVWLRKLHSAEEYEDRMKKLGARLRRTYPPLIFFCRFIVTRRLVEDFGFPSASLAQSINIFSIIKFKILRSMPGDSPPLPVDSGFGAVDRYGSFGVA